MTGQGELQRLQEQVARMAAALQERERQLSYAKQMASLGLLVAGIAHEIRTPIAAVSSTQDTLGRALRKLRQRLERASPGLTTEDSGVRLALEAIDEACRVIAAGSGRTLEIVGRIRRFARMDRSGLRETDLHDQLEDTLMLLHHELKHRVQVERCYGEIPSIRCNKGQINQVLLNLLLNAAQAIEEHGTITVSTWSEGQQVVVQVEDTGCGMSAEEQQRVFQAGFTTKAGCAGTGLGLSISREIVERHGGRLELESRRGEGTRVRLTLAVEPPPAAGQDPACDTH